MRPRNHNFIRVLLVEDNENDFILTRYLLESDTKKHYLIDWAANFDEAVAQIQRRYHDIYIFDYLLDTFSAVELIQAFKTEINFLPPIIVLTGHDSYELDLEVMRLGATDFICKSHLNSSILERSIRYALKQKHYEQQLLKLALYDSLTGLANRQRFIVALQDRIVQCKRNKQTFSFLTLELDFFKMVNDSFGHQAGDQVLVVAANKILSAVREADLVARLGGDEFAIMLSESTNAEDATAVANKICAAFEQPFTVDQTSFPIYASIGIASYPRDGDDAQELFKRSDIALYQAKNSGRNTCKNYDPTLDWLEQQKLAMLERLKTALLVNQFELHYQAQIDLENHNVIGIEVLVRWNHPELGNISPVEFIPLAETNNLIIPLGEWIFRQACKQLSEWQKIGIKIPLAINLSPAQFKFSGLADMLQASIDEFSVNPHLLMLEITETMLMSNSEQTKQQLDQLSDIGIQFAIDDFGTGYSSLAQLRNMNVNQLKIDRSFIIDITIDPNADIIVKAIINLGQSLKLNVIAEGVENKQQLDFLKNAHCDAVQGYYFCKPMPADRIINWLKPVPL
ncbi:MAG: GGDEF domain-containing response regulator [Methylococcales bacterium]